MDNDIPSVSDQARTAAGGIPTQFGAHGTTGEAPPRSATVYPPQPEMTPAQTQIQPVQINPNASIASAANGPFAAQQPAQPDPNQQVQPNYEIPSGGSNEPLAPEYPSAPQYPAEQAQLKAPSPDSRLAEAEADIQKLGQAMGTVLEKLDTLITNLPKQQTVQAGQPTPGMPTNTGQLGQYAPPAGVANPAAPTPHSPGGVQAPVQRIEGPAIPAPNPNAEPNPTARKIARVADDEMDLTVTEYIEKHFRMRDMSIDEMAQLAHLTAAEVTDILKGLGYQFPPGV